MRSFLKSNTWTLFVGVGLSLFLIAMLTSNTLGLVLAFLVRSELMKLIKYPPKCPFIGLGSLSITK